MKIIVIGASGQIGRALVSRLRDHDVVAASRASGVDITRPETVEALFQTTGKVDAVVCAAGEAVWKPLRELTDADFAKSLGSKLMGQVNLARLALPHLNTGGSITLTAGTYAREPEANSALLALVNAALEGFVIGAARDLRGIRINVVSPPLVGDLKMSGARVERMPPEDVAEAYLHALMARGTGEVIDARLYARR